MATSTTISQTSGTEHKIITLKPDGTQLSGFADDYITAPFTLNTKGSIGELKQGQIEINLDFYGGEDWDDKDIYFNPALFVNNNTQQAQSAAPNCGWKINIPVGLAAGEYPMLWYGCTGIDAPNRNYSCVLSYTDNTSPIIIKHTFYTTYDNNGYILYEAQQNNKRLLKSQRLDLNDLDVDSLTVYGGILKYYGYYVYVKDIVSNTSSRLHNWARVAFGMLNKSYQDGSPYFPEPSFLFEVNGVDSGQELSAINDTKVTFQIHDQFTRNPTNAFAWLIQVNNTAGGNIDWLTNYDYSFAEIITDAGNTTLHNAIKAPSTDLDNFIGDYYDITFHIDKDQLNGSGKYRVIVVIYANPADVSPFGSQCVNSYISEELTVGFIPPYDSGDCPQFTFDKKIIDYKSEVDASCVITVPEDRLKVGGNFIYDGIGAYYLQSMEDCLFERLGITMTGNDPRKYLKKITAEIYEEYVDAGDTIKNVFQLESINRTGVNTYSVPSSFDFYSNDWATDFYIWYNFRVRYEAGISCSYSYINGISVAPLTSQNWIGRNLILKLSFEFEYHDFSPAIVEVYNSYFDICVADYENESSTPVINFNGCAEDAGTSWQHIDAFIICTGITCDPLSTSPDVESLQSLGLLPSEIPMGLELLYINEWPIFAGVFQWNGEEFVLTHTVVKNDVICVSSKYVDGVYVPWAIYFTFNTSTYVIEDGCPTSLPQNCDNLFICKGDQVCIDAVIEIDDCNEYLVIATIDRPNYGIVNIQEEENEDGNLPRLGSNHLSITNNYFGDESYNSCSAEVCIDSTNLEIGKTYKVSVMGKKNFGYTCEVFESITTDSIVTNVGTDYNIDLTLSILAAASGTAQIYFLENTSKVFTLITTTNTDNWLIPINEHDWETGDGEVNIVVKHFDPVCPEVVNEWIVRLEFVDTEFVEIEKIEVVQGEHAESTLYRTRVSDEGEVANEVEISGANYFFNYIAAQRDKILRYNPFFGANVIAAMVPLIVNDDGGVASIGDGLDTNFGFINGDLTQFGALAGIQGDAASYINTGFNINIVTQFSQNDASIGLWSKTNNTNNSVEMGIWGSPYLAIGLYIGGTRKTPVNGDYATASSSVVSTSGIFIANRNNALTSWTHIDGVLTDVYADVSSGEYNDFITVFKANLLAGFTSDKLIAGYFIGKGLTSDQAKRLTSAIRFLFIITGKS